MSPLWFVKNLSLAVQLPEGFPGADDAYPKPPGATNPKYFEWLEHNSDVVYPALGLLVLVLLVLGILRAWKAQDLDGAAKAEFKREIIQELRRQLGGSSGEALARVIGLDAFKTMKLLEEMQRDGLLLSHTNTERLTIWRLKGVGPSAR